ncbi:MAG: ATP-dependent DNA helicase RecG [Anaerolineae bacterium]|nr:ATP-dependent DNA helicase RecG [Anaerolineae bacterium]
MTTPVEKLVKILALESELCQDRAVFGGLVRFADTWLEEAGRAFGPEKAQWVQAVAAQLRAYSKLSKSHERRAALQALTELLDARTVPPAAPSPPPTSPTPSPPTAVRPASPPQESRAEDLSGLEASLTTLRGVGERQADRMARLGLNTIGDLLFFLPRRYDDFSQLKAINRLEYGEEVTIVAKVWETQSRTTRGGSGLFTAVLSDGTGFIQVTWFNQPYLAERIRRNQQIVVSGRVDEYRGRLCLTSPQWEPLQRELLHTGRLVPVYALTEGITARWIRQLMKRTVDYWAPRLPDPLPDSVRRAHQLLDLKTALQQVHFPDSQDLLEKGRRRLAFEELFAFQLSLLQQRHLWRALPGRQIPIADEALQAFVLSLPFQLTGAQQRALAQIVDDLRSPYPMNRLLQGDVGSGKTVVAAAAMALVVQAGAQAALMAPTEILAEQHCQTLCQLFSAWPADPAADVPISLPVIRLLTGNVTGAERDEVYAGLADGSIDIVVGTHALIQKDVEFRDLALAVIDEQHRFGVRQRAALRQKGGEASAPYNPHMLVMTATPIPRSLQLTIWGHLDVSLIDEMPPGRQPVQTSVIMPRERERAYAFLRGQVKQGRQAFVICPLVEESDKIEAKAAVDEYKRLQEKIFPDLRLGLLHGRIKSEEKETIMSSFAAGEIDILVATLVVEVGIDVPNATVMMIEGAERFGMTQLHQFRGRVGRGEHPSYCLLVSDSTALEAVERLAAVESTGDGFVLAQRDLELRGPGEFLGTRQSGLPQFRTASLTNLELLEEVREAARQFFAQDPELGRPEHRHLARRVSEMWQGEGEIS